MTVGLSSVERTARVMYVQNVCIFYIQFQRPHSKHLPAALITSHVKIYPLVTSQLGLSSQMYDG